MRIVNPRSSINNTPLATTWYVDTKIDNAKQQVENLVSTVSGAIDSKINDEAAQRNLYDKAVADGVSHRFQHMDSVFHMWLLWRMYTPGRKRRAVLHLINVGKCIFGNMESGGLPCCRDILTIVYHGCMDMSTIRQGSCKQRKRHRRLQQCLF